MKRFVDTPRKADRAHHTPLRNLVELAQEFGVETQLVAAHMARDPSAPKAKLVTGKRHYYEPRAFRLWWRARRAQKTANNGGA